MRFTQPAWLFLLPIVLLWAAFLGWPARGARETRQRWSVGLRLAILLCLVLALAGLEVVRLADQLAVVFLIDASDSITTQERQAAAAWVETALAHSGPEDQSAMVVFGADALVERGLSPARSLGPLASRPNPAGTDLAAAIRLGLGLYPPQAARRMVLISDGIATLPGGRESAQLAAAAAGAAGVQIQSVPFLETAGPEALIASVEAPARLTAQETFDLWVTVESTQATEAGIQVTANGAPVYATRQILRAGMQTFNLALTAGKAGFYRYEVQIDPQQDLYFQNNRLATFSIASGPPQVLLAAGEDAQPGETRPLREALQASGFQVLAKRAAELPYQPGDLAPYAGVILVNLPARDLAPRQMEALRSYVRDLAGGLVAVGGPESFGVGGYFQTPLEDALPLDMQIKDQQRRPAVTILFVIDHSGSMADSAGGATKLELAKEAAIRSLDLLFPADRAGVIAFDETASWVAPLASLGDPAAVKNAIASLHPAGGTDILAGLQAAALALPQDPGQVKHVILLTDGGADPAGLLELVGRLHVEQGITLSTVGLGTDAAPFLAGLAEAGGGRYHYTADAGALPTIFAEETSLATRAYLEEHPFVPQAAAESPMLAGIESLPPLQGYVVTTAKQTAQVALLSDLGDPLLAVWQYGLGRAAAFTSDAANRWAQAWVAWADFPRFWGQVTGAVLRREAQDQRLEIDVQAPGETGLPDLARVIVDAQTPDGQTLNGYALAARITPPDGEPLSIPFQQVAPGLYQADFVPSGMGAYLLAVSGQPQGGDGTGFVSATAGWAYPYSPEYRLQPPDPQFLEELARLTGGGLAGDPTAVFRHDLPAPRAGQPAWPWLLSLALFLLPVDIALRRLAFPFNLRQTWVSLRARWLREAPAPTAAPRAARMDALLRTRQRNREQAPGASPGDAGPSQPGGSPRNEQPGAGEPAQTEVPHESPPDPLEPHPTSTASRLLARKREVDKDRSSS